LVIFCCKGANLTKKDDSAPGSNLKNNSSGIICIHPGWIHATSDYLYRSYYQSSIAEIIIMKKLLYRSLYLTVLAVLALGPGTAFAQNYEEVAIKTDEIHQTMIGFGASLAYYENWLTAHPLKAEIYDAIFAELSLDILRVRNTCDYDADMINRVSEFAQAAKTSLDKPIAILSSSWGPPGYLKSNNDRTHGGTLKYTVGQNGVEFDYAGFAQWWDKALDEYASRDIYPEYISIQNEPDWSADYESCLFKPAETVNASDTIAGYNNALDAVYDTIMKRDKKPKILGPETIGIGYDAVENYTNALNISKIFGIAHHLYHGADESNPYTSTNFTKVGNFHPEIPHFQTEYSRGDWFPLAGMIYKSLHDENAVAYLYWDLIWNDGGLVDLDFPWNPSQWTNPSGYTRTRHFFVFKQFSAFIHPGWERIGTSMQGNDWNTLAFASPDRDSATFVVINRSASSDLGIELAVDGYSIDKSTVFITSSTKNCTQSGALADSRMTVPPLSIATVPMRISELPPQIDCNGDTNGVAFIDSCGICAGGNTGVTPILDPAVCYPVDCNGDTNGLAFIDSCGICAGGNTGVIPIFDAENCANHLDDQKSPVSIYLHPNPVQEVLHIDITGEKGVLHVIDASGKYLLKNRIIENPYFLDVTDFENGIYVVLVMLDDRIFTRKFVKY
jgi:glucuronoarabinoxylan endo-1,4-beta-xylanase